MFLKFFIYADSKEEAHAIYNECMEDMTYFIVEIQEFEVKQYWKFSDMYVVKALLKLDITEDSFFCFLQSISDDWAHYGLPVINLLASETSPDCNYIKEKISMVTIFFEEEELYLIPKSERDK